MDTPAFTTTFTGAALTSVPSLITAVNARRPSSTRAPSMVLGSPTVNSTWGQTQKVQTYTVKVMQNDRCTLIEVDRETNLRKALLDAKVDLYTLGGKMRNCGGGGSCGTCLIDVEENYYMTNGRTAREEKLLQGKPESWRLACRTLINGNVTIRTKPKA